MKGEQAVPPVFSLTEFIEKVKDATEKEIEIKAEKDDIEIASLTTHPAWKKYLKVMEERIDYLKRLIDPDSKNSMILASQTPEEVGTLFLMISFCIDQIRKIILYPEALYESQRYSERIKGGK